jgi:hypothetical protein
MDLHEKNVAGDFKIVVPLGVGILTPFSKIKLLECTTTGLKTEEIISVECSAVSHTLVGSGWRRVLRVFSVKADTSKSEGKHFTRSAFANPIEVNLACAQPGEIHFQLRGIDGQVIDFGKDALTILILELT